MEQRAVTVGGQVLSYVDFGGPGPSLVALHGSFGRGSVFARLAADLGDRARVIAPDQRGHGLSPSAGGFGRDEFVSDAVAFLERWGPVVLLGHSLGGITAFQVAARRPDLVRALVIEDVGPELCAPRVPAPVLDVRGWPRSALTREALEEAILTKGIPDASYFLHSAVPDAHGWRFLFDWEQMMAVQQGGVGRWWSDWTATRCPTLVLRGGRSPLFPAEVAAEMLSRPDTRLVEFPTAGHWIHDDEPTAVAHAVAEFLAEEPHWP
ncbi:alpha/beta hydrolase [Actinokineospora sp. NBRC 105648]|uniref:alpha/beta fold hydrolase n=1 Tax=Actinokineospora sp. NBRC 105648 TaxID=3032206 RepID=UPI0024A24F84|nr:alpha/beta hydrolase [Actinokineospora sp. NBRC 105648]GLZ40445.1 hypothetical protein Acsp05_40690 [Actinokineospora sp. NBRC 105648]